jgi:threonine synthase
MWQYAALLPIVQAADIVSIGEGNTPLLPSRQFADAHGYANVYLKMESLNPTWSHKDRYNAVGISMARALGYKRIVTGSTGNHGVSAAAYAAAAGLGCVVFYPPETPRALLSLTSSYGATTVVTGWDARQMMVTTLTRRGWYPAASWMPGRVHNPYSIEGYKTLAFEVVRDLGRVPDKVLIPVAAGNTLYGMWKGFRELRELGLASRTPQIVACHAAGANALEVSFKEGRDDVVVLEQAFSIATSTRERTAGRQALESVRESGGTVVSVTDEAIVHALKETARRGLSIETASAIPIACVTEMISDGQLRRDETAVCIVTSAGIKWPDTLSEMSPPPLRIGVTEADLMSVIPRLEA